MSGAWRVAAVATFALLALQWLPVFAPHAGEDIPAWWLPTAFSLPLLFPALLFLMRRPRAPLWAGIAALFYFCLGIAEFRVWRDASSLIEVALSLVIVFAAGWPGIAAKMAKRRAAPPPNV